MKTHELKTLPYFWEAVADGRKTWEYRRDDRGFQVGDIVVLREWHPLTERYTGRTLERWITFMVHGGHVGIPDLFCVFSLSTTPPDASGKQPAAGEVNRG